MHLLSLHLFAFLSAHGGGPSGGADGGSASHRPQVFLQSFSFLSEYLVHLLSLHLFHLSAHGDGASHRPQVFLQFFFFFFEYFLHLLSLHFFAFLSAHSGGRETRRRAPAARVRVIA